ncbi:TPA: hypothetical protein PNM84_001345 [Listeria monocytogenes]|nr:hypothetical protein [Listeria monocytogenes]HAA9071024.1 hypothetical protein [Listeria monocytogenes]HDI4828577.1 hypothetical protein [Listeria monocytogenes]HDM9928158.1 hypothetical protein [Listeria monocytogenes]
MFQHIRRTFHYVEPFYFMRDYLFSGLLTLVLFHISPSSPSISFYFFLGINFILYPFAMVTYDSLVNLVLGTTIWFTEGVLTIIWVLIRTLLIYSFSLIIAPIGFIFLFLIDRLNGKIE